MRRNKLFSLLADNRGKGSFRAEAATNEIFIYDIIVGSRWEADIFGGVSPEGVIAALNGMAGPVTFRINSPGGDVFGARAIEQAIREYEGPVTAQIDGVAASAASLIAVSAGRTVMAPGSLMMIHKSWCMTVGNSDDHMSAAALLEKIDGTLAETYAAKSGKSADHYAALLAAETWFTPQEAVDEGLADEIAGATDKKSNCWNLSAYERAPKLGQGQSPAHNAGVEMEHRKRKHRLAMLRHAA